MPLVSLDLEQRRVYVPEGIARYVRSKRNGWTFNGYDRDNAMAIDIAAAGAEMAAAIALGLPWTGDINSFKAPDVGKRIQVRWTKYDDGCLLIGKDDNVDHIYVLVTGPEPDFFVRKWCWGHEHRVPGYWRGPRGVLRGAWFIPQSVLHPLSELEAVAA